MQWTPPQWSAKSAMVSITAPTGAQISAAVVQQSTAGFTQVAAPVVSGPVTYIFDAVLAVEHAQTLTKTHHPVQTGTAISSHAYIEPAQLVLSVLMSDVVGTYTGSAAWTGNSSKSVSAYQQMLSLQAARIPLTVVTRLRTYYNMLILKVSPREDDKTITGARFRLEFEQIFIANTQASPVSSRPNDTAATGLGAVNAQVPSVSTINQFGVDIDPVTGSFKSLLGGVVPVDVPGAGAFSSVNVNSLQSLLRL